MSSDDDPADARVNWVKASDYPHVTREGPPPSPAEIEASYAWAARTSDYRIAVALGHDPARPAELDAGLAAAPRFTGLAYQALRHPVEPGIRRLRGLLLATALPGIALQRPETARGARQDEPPLELPHRVLAVVSATGRDAAALSARPVERPVVFARGTTLRFLEERDLDAADVVLAVDESDAHAHGTPPDDLLWLRVRDALDHAEPPPPGADTWTYLAGSPL